MNEENFRVLYTEVMADPSIDDVQRNRDLETIGRVMTALQFGEIEPEVDRLSMIREIAERKQKSASFRKKLKTKSRKVRRNATEDTRSIRGLDAFDEKFMYSSDDEVRRFADGIGITETYAETKRFDDEWN